jgi:hypothetical protein
MPNARTHQAAATLVGVGAGLYTARNVQQADAVLARIAGSVLAANLAAALPDLLEPGVHSWHRKSCHSIAALAGATRLAVKVPQRVVLWLSERENAAARLRAAREALPPDHADRFWLWLSEMIEHMLIGAAIGAPAGYASHLVLDGCSPRGLPPI